MSSKIPDYKRLLNDQIHIRLFHHLADDGSGDALGGQLFAELHGLVAGKGHQKASGGLGVCDQIHQALLGRIHDP